MPLPPPLFADTFELRGTDQRTKDQAVARRQADELTRGVSDEPSDDRLLRTLATRRAEPRRGAPAHPFVSVREGRSPTMVSGGDVLVSASGLSVEDKQTLEADGFTEDVGGPFLGGRVTRFRHPGNEGFRPVREAVEKMKAKGVLAGPETVMALLPRDRRTVVKSLSGPSRTVIDDRHRGRGQRATVLPTVRRRKVAVIDTGIGPTRADAWLDEVDRDGVEDPLDVFPTGQRLDFAAGHGTFAAGIVRQVDAEAEIVAYRALDSDGLGSELDVAEAMVQAVRDGADVVNLSCGMRTYDDEPPVALRAALDEIEQIVAAEPARDRPVIVAAAGNYAGDDRPVWPAAFDEVVAVAGLAPSGAGAAWSSRGTWVDFSTVAEGIVSTFVAGREDRTFAPPGATDAAETYDDPAWAMWVGTSFAAPQIAGAISRLSRRTGSGASHLSPTTALDLIKEGAITDASLAGFGHAVTILPGT